MAQKLDFPETFNKCGQKLVKTGWLAVLKLLQQCVAISKLQPLANYFECKAISFQRVAKAGNEHSKILTIKAKLQ